MDMMCASVSREILKPTCSLVIDINLILISMCQPYLNNRG